MKKLNEKYNPIEMKVNIDADKKTILFICSPSLGILDSWISVMILLKKKLPNAQFIFVAPKSSIISGINLDTELIKMASTIFDKVVFKSKCGAWLYSNSFFDAKKINISSNFNLFNFPISLMKKLRLEKLAQILKSPYKVVVSIFYSKFLFDLHKISQTKYATLFDVTQFDKSYVQDLNSLISSRNNFSIIHGVNPRPTSHIKTKLLNGKDVVSTNKHLTQKSTVFALSEKEREFYEIVYGLNGEQIKVCGIPRHEKQWMKTLIEKEDVKKNNEKNILVISRPVSTVLPLNRKKKSLEMIKIIAKQLGYKVIIKLHPKEKYYKYFEDIFELNEYKKSWEISTKHPFVLGKNCEYAVSFYSGVPIDLIVFGVPTVELLDLKGIEDYDNECALRDDNGEAVLNPRYLNLVLGTSSFEGFQKHVKRILNDRNNVIKELQKEYEKNFPILENVNDKIAQYICENIN